jgi:hypothetical protein
MRKATSDSCLISLSVSCDNAGRAYRLAPGTEPWRPDAGHGAVAFGGALLAAATFALAVGFFLLPLWLVVVGVLLARRQEPAAA